MIIKEGMSIKDEISLKIGKGFKDGMGMSGNMVAKLYGPDGLLKDRREVHNTVTTLAHDMIADQLDDAPSVAKPGWMEVGTGSGQGSGDSTLATYISGSRTALDSSTTTAEDVVMVCTFGAGTGTGAITEAGVFNVVTQNTTDMIMYADFGVITKGGADSLEVTWTLTFA